MVNVKFVKTGQKIIFCGLLVITALLPFVFSVKTVSLVLAKTVFFQIGLTFLLLVWFLKLVDSEEIKLPKNPVLIPFLLFLVYTLISASTSLYKYSGFLSFLSTLYYFLFFVLVIENITERKQVSFILKTILTAAAVISFFSLYKNVSAFKFDFWRYPVFFHFFGNPNFFASFLIFVLPLSLSFFIYSRRRVEKVVLFIFSLLFTLTLLLTYSQGAWIILCFYFIILYACIITKFWSNKKTLKGLGFALLPFLIILILYLMIIHAEFSLEKYLFPKTVSLSMRKEIWESAWRMIKVFPFMGWGAGSFHIYFPLFRITESVSVITVPIVLHAHNEFLEIAAEMGFFGLVLFLWIIFAFFKLSLQLWIKAPFSRQKYPFAFFLGGLGILMHNLISPSLRSTAIAVFFWLLIALTVAVKNIVSSESGEAEFIVLKNRFFSIFKPVKKGLLYGLAIALFIPFSLELIKPYQAERALKEGIEFLNTESLPQAIMKFEEALKINPNCVSAYYKLGYTCRLTGQDEKALESYLALQRIVPNYARIHYNLGCIYQSLGQYRQAIGEFEISLKQEGRILPRYRLKEIYAELERKK